MTTNRNTTMIAPAYTSTCIDADELRVHHHVERREAEHRDHEPHRGGHRALARHERERGRDGDEAEEIEVERIEERKVALPISLTLRVGGIPHLAHRMRLRAQPLEVVDEPVARVLGVLVVAPTWIASSGQTSWQ